MLLINAHFRRDEALTRLLGGLIFARRRPSQLADRAPRPFHRHGKEKLGSRDSRRRAGAGAIGLETSSYLRRRLS